MGKNKPKAKAKPAKTAEEIERQAGVVQFPVDGMGDDADFDRRVRLEKLLGDALTRAKLGGCDGGDGGSGTMNVFLGITDPPAARQLILKTLADSGNADDTVVAYADDPETGVYDVWWPADYPYTFTIFGPVWKGPLPKAELDAMPADLRAMQGLWRVTRYDGPGGSRFDPWWAEVRIMVVRDRLTLRHGVSIVSGARIALNPRKKHIDLAPTLGPNRGRPAPGVYVVRADAFEFCVQPQGEDRPAKLLPESEHQEGRLVLQREPSAG